MGTYATGTTRLPSSGSDGCWLEAAPVSADTMHVQILCRYPAPGHHLGVLDARLRMSGATVVYQRGETSDPCRIRIRFSASRALVAQHGSDLACGFGAFVDVSGTYTRLSSRRPPFDLAPIERPSVPMPERVILGSEGLTRLARLLETPKDIPVLAPRIVRELYYRLLQGEQHGGATLPVMHSKGSNGAGRTQ